MKYIQFLLQTQILNYSSSVPHFTIKLFTKRSQPPSSSLPTPSIATAAQLLLLAPIEVSPSQGPPSYPMVHSYCLKRASVWDL